MEDLYRSFHHRVYIRRGLGVLYGALGIWAQSRLEPQSTVALAKTSLLASEPPMSRAIGHDIQFLAAFIFVLVNFAADRLAL